MANLLANYDQLKLLTDPEQPCLYPPDKSKSNIRSLFSSGYDLVLVRYITTVKPQLDAYITYKLMHFAGCFPFFEVFMLSYACIIYNVQTRE